ncbi:helix-turn-helix domain-containing protein [Streptomyces decoyicus]|uniref:helix-turn-helix domain-containing protein n=1 Tax=Streptomyces decoyicus TaxID=249567 RepID=UPI00398CD695
MCENGSTAAPKNSDDAAPSSANRLLPGQAGYPLSCALSYLRRTNETTVGSLAFLTGVSASYIYRITSGERTPTWEVTQRFAIACETEPENLMFLWNRAHSLEALPPAAPRKPSVPSRRPFEVCTWPPPAPTSPVCGSRRS